MLNKSRIFNVKRTEEQVLTKAFEFLTINRLPTYYEDSYFSNHLHTFIKSVLNLYIADL